MSIEINKAIELQMVSQAEHAYPNESCGLLVGSNSGADADVAHYYYPCTNQQPRNQKRRFLIEPQSYQMVEDMADAAGLSIVSIVHSHPDHPDLPSEFDQQHAWPGLSYIIISVVDGRMCSYHAWRLSDDRREFNLESVTVRG